nr:F0F1 ATP synthase subunit B [uncultured Acetatifactor sp.]
MERLFDLDWQLLADSSLTIIAIFFLFLALSYLLFNPARKVLNERREKIRNDLDGAQRDMEDARSLKAQYEEKLKNINSEAEVILNEARKKALISERQIIAQAREEAGRILEKARAEAELERVKAADDMKKEMVSIASLMAEKAVLAVMDTSVQNRLIEETLKNMGESTWKS